MKRQSMPTYGEFKKSFFHKRTLISQYTDGHPHHAKQRPTSQTYTHRSKFFIYEKQFVFFIFLFTVSISLTRCKKEGIGTDTPRKDLGNASQTASNRTGDLAALDFEAELNANFTSTQYRKDISVYEEISFPETGYFSETRQSEIRNLIQNMITSRQGQKPFYIDIDSKDKKVIVAFAQEKVEGGNINDALNWEGNSFENLMASQINCGYPIIFPTDISVRPNGGIPDAFCASGTFVMILQTPDVEDLAGLQKKPREVSRSLSVLRVFRTLWK